MVLLTRVDAVQTQGRNIRSYSTYLIERAQSFSKAKIDYVRNGEGRLKRLSVDKGLLRETEVVQDQLQALLGCDVCVVWKLCCFTANRVIVLNGGA